MRLLRAGVTLQLRQRGKDTRMMEMTPAQLKKVAEKLANPRTPKAAEKFKREYLRGFYGKRSLAKLTKPRLVRDSSTGLFITQGPKGSKLVKSDDVRADETWLFKNRPALASVKRGLKESAQGKTVYRGSFAENAKKKPLLPPPTGFKSWLDWTVAHMDTRLLQVEHGFDCHPKWPTNVTRKEMHQAALAELAELRRKISSKGLGVSRKLHAVRKMAPRKPRKP